MAEAHHWGRASSWLAVTVIMVGSAVVGAGICMGPNWFVLWTGVAARVIGAILVPAFRVFQDVVLDAPRTTRDQTGQSGRGILD